MVKFLKTVHIKNADECADRKVVCPGCGQVTLMVTLNPVRGVESGDVCYKCLTSVSAFKVDEKLKGDAGPDYTDRTLKYDLYSFPKEEEDD